MPPPRVRPPRRSRGRGIDGSLAVPGNGEGRPDTPLGELVQHGGWFSAVFGADAVGPVTEGKRPAEPGPKYLVTYRMPGPDRTTDTIRQDIYPYAKPAPAAYMAPGQPFWNGQHTRGGWSTVPRELVTRIGLPATAPATGSHLWRWIGIAAAALLAALLLRSLPRLRRASTA